MRFPLRHRASLTLFWLELEVESEKPTGPRGVGGAGGRVGDGRRGDRNVAAGMHQQRAGIALDRRVVGNGGVVDFHADQAAARTAGDGGGNAVAGRRRHNVERHAAGAQKLLSGGDSAGDVHAEDLRPRRGAQVNGLRPDFVVVRRGCRSGQVEHGQVAGRRLKLESIRGIGETGQFDVESFAVHVAHARRRHGQIAGPGQGDGARRPRG